MRSVLTGSLALIVLYVFSQDAAANKVGAGSSAIVNLIRRALSPSVAGLPNKRKDTSFHWPGTTTQTEPKVYSTIYHT